MSRSRLRPLQSELCAALQLCSDVEEEARQRELAAARASLQLGRRESALECLLELSGQLVAALQQYRALLEGVHISHSMAEKGQPCLVNHVPSFPPKPTPPHRASRAS